ncbi:cysteine-rich secretory protein family domain-containing protein [Ditylenchus destructor]|uniref:Cysteine-rich secretory protein family domain-containing protein n=1 Tax=Ditylenchus destructor TaxID=166010 RepID=A0AAD4R5H0_9BILA|nr:cysteine-rich secretory protein family domain-containing protein [Ditylenchus destructor]
MKILLYLTGLLAAASQVRGQTCSEPTILVGSTYVKAPSLIVANDVVPWVSQYARPVEQVGNCTCGGATKRFYKSVNSSNTVGNTGECPDNTGFQPPVCVDSSCTNLCIIDIYGRTYTRQPGATFYPGCFYPHCLSGGACYTHFFAQAVRLVDQNGNLRDYDDRFNKFNYNSSFIRAAGVSCNGCDALRSSFCSSACIKDVYATDCPKYASWGNCRTDEYWMSQSCAKSCLCGQSTTTTTTTKNRALIVDAHNNHRSKLALGQEPNNPSGYAAPAANMYKFEYDCKLENVAQAWANVCSQVHSTSQGRKCTGENLYMYSATIPQPTPQAMQSAADLWWHELIEYGLSTTDTNYYSSSMNDLGHFTQMAWAQTLRVGCGISQCASTTYVVCNYNVTGNINTKSIYQIGNACSNCTTYPGSTCDSAKGLCVAPSGDRPCEDRDTASACSYFQTNGYCSASSSAYCQMRRDCAKTCGLCNS